MGDWSPPARLQVQPVGSLEAAWPHAFPGRAYPRREGRERTGLPPAPELFGRDALLQALQSRIDRGGLVFLWGEGGMGKTALAGRAAVEAVRAGRLPAGAAWVGCEYGPGLEECLRQAAHAFWGSRLESETVETCRERVGQHLLGRPALLVLDNLETVGEVERVLAWLEELPAPARVLVTTREWLPCYARLGTVLEVRQLSRADAVALFEKRARDGGWEGFGAEHVPDLCGAVGDHPLAIELLAARTAAGLSPSRLLQRVRESLRVLEVQDSRRPARHQSAQACFQISWEQLSAGARELLVRVSVLPDGVGEETMAVILGTEAWDEDAEALVQASVLRFVSGRYGMHPLVRQFSRGQLGDRVGEVEGAVARSLIRQGTTFGGWAALGAASQADSTRALDWLEREWRNLQAAAGFLWETGERELVAEFSDALRDFAFTRGYLGDVEALHERALAARRAVGDDTGAARTLDNLGLLRQCRGWRKEAEAAYREAAELAGKEETAEAAAIEARALCGLGITLGERGAWGEAVAALDRSRSLCRRSGDRRQEGIALNNLGLLHSYRREWSTAEEAFRASLELRLETGDAVGAGYTLRHLASALREQRQWEEAEATLERSLELCRETGDRVGESTTLFDLGHLHRVRGYPDRAIGLYRELLEQARRAGDPVGQLRALLDLGRTCREHERWEEGEAALRRSQALAEEHRLFLEEFRSLMELGFLYRFWRRWPDATAAYEAARQRARAEGDRPCEAAAIVDLGNVAWEQDQPEEAVRRLEQALTYEERDEAGIRYWLGLLYTRLTAWPEAEQAFQRALELRSRAGQKLYQGSNLAQLGNIYRITGRLAEAEEALLESLRLLEGERSPRYEGPALRALAELRWEQGRGAEALELARCALATLRQLPMPRLVTAEQLIADAEATLARFEREHLASGAIDAPST